MQSILVIDDEWPIRELLCQALEDEGYHVRAASNGNAGLRMLEHELPALILCDVMMPGLDGYGFCRALRANPSWAAIPLIFISAASTVPPPNDCVYSAFLPKPMTIDALLTLVHQVLASA